MALYSMRLNLIDEISCADYLWQSHAVQQWVAPGQRTIRGSMQGRIAVWYNEANQKRGVCITVSDGKAMIDGSRTQRTR